MKKSRYLLAFLTSTALILAVSLGVLFAAVFFGAFDTVECNYQTREDAVADRLFERGWLPSIIPASSSNIEVSSNLDINTSVCSFSFNPKEFDEFVRTIKNTTKQDTCWIGEYPRMQILSDRGYMSFYYRHSGTVWRFFVHPQHGICECWAHNI